jgi:chorismate-pyruvate lyase
VTEASFAAPDLPTLVGLFYSQPLRLGRFAAQAAEELPPPYRRLLAHQNHMTVTVEQFHGCSVDVRVLETSLTGEHYSRKILLARQSDAQVVQFGIVRLDFQFVSQAVREAVESESTPLGRILIQHNVLREVHLSRLWRVEAGEDLAALMSIQPGTVTFGRTAIIDCNGEPAVELLEIVAPVTAGTP